MPKLKLTLAMLVFGTIGIFVRYLPISSSITALFRGAVGTAFLILFLTLSGHRISKSRVKANLLLLILSGTAIGINWILLFESYHYTTVAISTLCYYLAPVFVIILSTFILKEKLSIKKILCIITVLTGMVFVSGIMGNHSASRKDFLGIFLGIGAAVFYASVVLINKFLKEISSYDSTVVQLGVASIILLPYTLLTEDYGDIPWKPSIIILLLILGIVHTGIAYWLYFSSMSSLDGQTIALFSYIDPALAILLSAFLLKEKLDLLSITGALMILGSTLLSQLQRGEKARA